MTNADWPDQLKCQFFGPTSCKRPIISSVQQQQHAAAAAAAAAAHHLLNAVHRFHFSNSITSTRLFCSTVVGIFIYIYVYSMHVHVHVCMYVST